MSPSVGALDVVSAAAAQAPSGTSAFMASLVVCLTLPARLPAALRVEVAMLLEVLRMLEIVFVLFGGRTTRGEGAGRCSEDILPILLGAIALVSVQITTSLGQTRRLDLTRDAKEQCNKILYPDEAGAAPRNLPSSPKPRPSRKAITPRCSQHQGNCIQVGAPAKASTAGSACRRLGQELACT